MGEERARAVRPLPLLVGREDDPAARRLFVRRMNNSRQRYNPMSEHAHGNAIDVGKFVLKNGHQIDVRRKGLFSFREGRLLKAVRSTAADISTPCSGRAAIRNTGITSISI